MKFTPGKTYLIYDANGTPTIFLTLRDDQDAKNLALLKRKLRVRITERRNAKIKPHYSTEEVAA